MSALGITLCWARDEDKIVGDDGAEVAAFEEFGLSDALREEGYEGAATALGAVVVHGGKTFGAEVGGDF